MIHPFLQLLLSIDIFLCKVFDDYFIVLVGLEMQLIAEIGTEEISQLLLIELNEGSIH